jgi:dGTPase
MNLTAATLACMVKYPTQAADPAADVHFRGKFGFFASEVAIFEQVRDKTGLPKGARHPLTYLVEAADDIVNRLIDIEDALKIGLVAFEEVVEELNKVAKENDVAKKLCEALTGRKKAGPMDPGQSIRDQELYAYYHFRTKAIAEFTTQCESAFLRNYAEIAAFKFGLADLVSKCDLAPLYTSLKSLEKRRIFGDPEIVRTEAGGKIAMTGVLDTLHEALSNADDKLGRTISTPMKFAHEEEPAAEYLRVQKTVDYVAGMTDTYVVELFGRLRGTNL